MDPAFTCLPQWAGPQFNSGSEGPQFPTPILTLPNLKQGAANFFLPLNSKYTFNYSSLLSLMLTIAPLAEQERNSEAQGRTQFRLLPCNSVKSQNYLLPTYFLRFLPIFLFYPVSYLFSVKSQNVPIAFHPKSVWGKVQALRCYTIRFFVIYLTKNLLYFWKLLLFLNSVLQHSLLGLLF